VRAGFTFAPATTENTSLVPSGWYYFFRLVRLVVEASLELVHLSPPQRTALTDVCDALKSVGLVTEDACNELVLHASHIVCDAETVIAGGPVVDRSPLAVLPDGALHRAALGHLDTVQGVAVGAEETSDEIVTAAELATLGVHLLPPVLVVASAGLDGTWHYLTRLIWPLALGTVQVIQGIHAGEQIGLQAGNKESLLASRPAPLVHALGPHGVMCISVGVCTLSHLAASRSVVVVVWSTIAR
jgi:hypothetical protein